VAIGSVASLKRLAEGREAEIFDWEPGVILKLYRGVSGLRSREVEWLAMTAIAKFGGPAPAAIGLLEIEGRVGLLMERIDGADLLTELGRAPWKVRTAGTLTGTAQALVNKTPAPPQLERLKVRLQRQIESSPHVPDEYRPLAARALAELPDGDRLCHGDLHPANVMRTAHGTAVIDWSNAASGDPAADVARTLIILTFGEPPPGTSQITLRLQRLGRRILRSRYYNAYQSAHPIDVARIASWRLPIAIARLSDGIDAERARLLKAIEQTAPISTR
jgi:aminoglycoside phosphotransferase (APT) family kinase protein